MAVVPLGVETANNSAVGSGVGCPREKYQVMANYIDNVWGYLSSGIPFPADADCTE